MGGKEKSRGAYFEAGYAKAHGKKVFVVHKTGIEANFLESVADVVIQYEDEDELEHYLKNLR